MDGWRVEVLDARVAAEVAALPADMRARLAHIEEMMVELGPQRMREPHVKSLGGKLWEMRMGGRSGIARAIYAIGSGKRIVILHAFMKKTQKTPPQAIRLALRRAKELAP